MTFVDRKPTSIDVLDALASDIIRRQLSTFLILEVGTQHTVGGNPP